jgi:hypothetical protein
LLGTTVPCPTRRRVASMTSAAATEALIRALLETCRTAYGDAEVASACERVLRAVEVTVRDARCWGDGASIGHTSFGELVLLRKELGPVAADKTYLCSVLPPLRHDRNARWLALTAVENSEQWDMVLHRDRCRHVQGKQAGSIKEPGGDASRSDGKGNDNDKRKGHGGKGHDKGRGKGHNIKAGGKGQGDGAKFASNRAGV